MLRKVWMNQSFFKFCEFSWTHLRSGDRDRCMGNWVFGGGVGYCRCNRWSGCRYDRFPPESALGAKEVFLPFLFSFLLLRIPRKFLITSLHQSPGWYCSALLCIQSAACLHVKGHQPILACFAFELLVNSRHVSGCGISWEHGWLVA